MALEISPVESFNQIKKINKLLNRKSEKTIKEPKEEEVTFTINDEIDLRSFILENTSPNDLTRTDELVKMCRKRGYEQSIVVAVIKSMIEEDVLETLENRFIMQNNETD